MEVGDIAGASVTEAAGGGGSGLGRGYLWVQAMVSNAM